MMRCLAWTLLAAATSWPAGCQTTGSACDGWQAIRPTRQDVQVISERLSEGILSHNRHGAKTCGWKASRG